METIIVLVLIAIVIIVLKQISQKGATSTKSTNRAKTYAYEVKNRIMTERELIFYDKLNNVVHAKYAVIPQAHLSAFLNHKVKGQNWKGAFSVINGKSVDYLLVDKNTQRPTIAIELDDYTHQSESRIQRDRKVEDIMQASGMRLVRFSDVNCTEDQIFSRLAQQ